MLKSFLEKSWKHILAIVAFFLITLINFYPRLQDKHIQAGDMISVNASQNEVRSYHEETGEKSYWTNALFSGMPTYFIYYPKARDAVDYVRMVLRGGLPGEAGMFFMGMVSFYILMVLLNISPLLAVFGAIGFAFTTNNIVLLNAGHFTKIATLMSSPLVIAGVILSYRKKWLLGIILFAFGIAVNLKNDHPQMTYFLGLVLFPYVIVQFVSYLKRKELLSFIKISALLVLALVIGAACSASKLLPVKEYSEDTMRGKPILQENKDDFSSSGVEGLSWDYAMNWSNGWEDLLQGFIPLAVGGSSAENLEPDSNFAKELRKRGVNTRSGIQAPMYWGSLPFTSGPIYFGAIVFLLFFISLFVYKENIKWWILIAVVLTFLLSLGKNLEFLSRFFYDYFPMYNKFRTPNSILSITAVIIPLLAILGLDYILRTKPDWKKVMYPGLGLLMFTLLVAFIGPGISDLSSATDARYAQMGLDPEIFKSDRADMMRSSALRSAFLMVAVLALIYGFYKNKIKKEYVIAITGIMIAGDLITTNFRYLKPSDYVSKRNYEANFQPRPVDQQILQDPDPHYRVLDLSIATFESSASSYHHKTIGGYHAAKLQRYQDMIDHHISRNNMDVLNMLNTKYIISPGPENEPEVQRNPAALGNAWFVNEYRIVNNADKEILALNDFDPLGEAIIHQEFSDYVNGLNSSKDGSIRLTQYKPNELVYESQTNSEQLAVFSEVWYGPDKGWKAYIDGEPVEHIRTNYILRALRVPSGSHEIRFVFDPDSIKTGYILSLICSIIILAAFGFYFYTVIRGLQTSD